MEELKEIIAHNIASLRKQNGMTQLELAERLNYSDKAVSKWERGESIPDIAVLKSIAELFGVTLDYLVRADHSREESMPQNPHSKRNRVLITGMSIVLVWLIATFLFINFNLVSEHFQYMWHIFVYAVPASMVVWLVFNALWFNPRRNFLIISLLVWTLLVAIYLPLMNLSVSLWQIFFIGIPAQVIIVLWSGIRWRPADKKAKKKNKKHAQEDTADESDTL